MYVESQDSKREWEKWHESTHQALCSGTLFGKNITERALFKSQILTGRDMLTVMDLKKRLNTHTHMHCNYILYVGVHKAEKGRI